MYSPHLRLTHRMRVHFLRLAALYRKSSSSVSAGVFPAVSSFYDTHPTPSWAHSMRLPTAYDDRVCLVWATYDSPAVLIGGLCPL